MCMNEYLKFPYEGVHKKKAEKVLGYLLSKHDQDKCQVFKMTIGLQEKSTKIKQQEIINLQGLLKFCPSAVLTCLSFFSSSNTPKVRATL